MIVATFESENVICTVHDDFLLKGEEREKKIKQVKERAGKILAAAYTRKLLTEQQENQFEK